MEKRQGSVIFGISFILTFIVYTLISLNNLRNFQEIGERIIRMIPGALTALALAISITTTVNNKGMKAWLKSTIPFIIILLISFFLIRLPEDPISGFDAIGIVSIIIVSIIISTIVTFIINPLIRRFYLKEN